MKTVDWVILVTAAVVAFVLIDHAFRSGSKFMGFLAAAFSIAYLAFGWLYVSLLLNGR